MANLRIYNHIPAIRTQASSSRISKLHHQIHKVPRTQWVRFW